MKENSPSESGPPPELKFTDLNVTLLYGFALRPKNGRGQDSDFKLKEVDKGPEEEDQGVWTPMYRLPKQLAYFQRARNFCELPNYIYIHRPEQWSEKDDPLPVKLSCEASVRETDGFGCLSLVFDCDEKKKTEYTVGDLLSLLLLSPRSLELGDRNGRTDERSRVFVEGKLLFHDRQSKGDSYLLLESAMQSFCSNAFKNQVEWLDPTESGLYGNDPKTDPQIPYAFVEAVISKEIYDTAFLEDRENVDSVRDARKAYSKDIAAILARWLTPDNVPFASLDYWEGRNLARAGVFRNLYMNSLSFVTFSGQVTLILRPEDDQRHFKKPTEQRELPQLPAKHSLLRCLEIARTRWHHALCLNDALDDFVNDVVKTKQTARDFVRHFSRLRELKKSIAVHLEDPFVYLWDATVGSQLSEYLRQNVMELVEKSVFSKLALVKEILLDLADEARTREFAGLLDRKLPKG